MTSKVERIYGGLVRPGEERCLPLPVAIRQFEGKPISVLGYVRRTGQFGTILELIIQDEATGGRHRVTTGDRPVLDKVAEAERSGSWPISGRVARIGYVCDIV